MLLINQSFFIRENNIPNINNAGVLERVNAFIAKYEPECLLKLFGYPLYKLFGTESSQRMTDLISGAEYTDANGLSKWQGLIHDTDISLIANYIWYHYQENDASQKTGVNISVPKGEASIVVSPMEKMVASWNFFSKESEQLIYFLWNKTNEDGSRVYPEFTNYQYFESLNFSSRINIFGI